jgi:hypothetical protein
VHVLLYERQAPKKVDREDAEQYWPALQFDCACTPPKRQRATRRPTESGVRARLDAMASGVDVFACQGRSGLV